MGLMERKASPGNSLLQDSNIPYLSTPVDGVEENTCKPAPGDCAELFLF